MDRKKYDESLRYLQGLRPLLDKDALFSDETEDYQFPQGAGVGEKVTIRFRTRKDNVDKVTMISGDLRLPMEKAYTAKGFDFYEGQIILDREIFRYYFEIQLGKLVCYYTELGVGRQADPAYSFGMVPGFITPEWAKGAVIYQIFVDRFYNGDPANDVLTNEYSYIGEGVVKEEDWSAAPRDMDVRIFYGGDLEGVRKKLDYLQDLGVEVLYLNPIFVSPSNHKYDIQDYDYVDPHYGRILRDQGRQLEGGAIDNRQASRYIQRVTDLVNLEASNDLLKLLIEDLHSRGMKVILDGVFNHCGSFNKWLDRERIYEGQSHYKNGAFVDGNSPYRSYFKFNNESAWPYNESYEGWWGHDTLPKLNYEESKALEDYILQIGKKWVSPPYNADGWRLDVAADLGKTVEYNHRFWKKFRDAVKSANPDAIILAEHYGDCSSWLQGDQWDSVMNYDAFMEPISWFLTGMEKHSDSYREDLLGNGEAFHQAMKYHMARFYGQSLHVAMNELDNHDHSRFLTRTNHKVGRVGQLGSAAASENLDYGVLREAVIMQMTWPGAPTLYYGNEAGVCGFTDPDNRRTYPWGREDQQLLQFYKDAIAFHKEFRLLRKSSFLQLIAEENLLAYGRFSPNEQLLVLVNNGQDRRTEEVQVWRLGLSRYKESYMRQVFMTDRQGYSKGGRYHRVYGGVLTLTIEPKSALVLYHKD